MDTEQIRDWIMQALNDGRTPDAFKRVVESDATPIDGEAAFGIAVDGAQYFVVVERA